MRPIDWRSVLTEHRVPFIERGPNVKRGEINVRCPMCGSADPSYHMGLNLETGWWCCWRNQSAHKGKSPVRLLVSLLNVPYWRAREIAGLRNDAEYTDPDGFDAVAARVMKREGFQRPEQVQRRHLKFDREFRRLDDDSVASLRFLDYLLDRGFTKPAKLGELYGLRYAISGDFKDRIILPYYMNGELVTWTGRAISKQAMIRYKDLPLDDSLIGPKHTLFNHDCILEGGRALIVQEGPFDALKVDYYARDHLVRSAALSTNSITEDQIALLLGASSKFERIIVVMDMATPLGLADSMRMKGELSFLPNVEIAKVPFGAKDGGDLTHKQVREWITLL